MAIYAYKGLDRSGKEIRGQVKSETIAVAKQKVKAGGVILTEINEESAAKKQTRQGFKLGGRVGVNDLAMMTRQLATLISARIQVVQALTALTDQVENPTLQVVLSDLKQKVNEGSSLAKALAENPKVFNNIYVNMVEAGEASGTLDIVLVRLAEFTESQVKLRNKIKSALYYPIIMAVVGSGLLSFIFLKIIPDIARIFQNGKRELPLMTEISLWISEFLQSYILLLVLAIVFGVMLFLKVISKGSGQRRWHSFLLKAPVIGKLNKMINVSRFCSTLATLLDAGVPILTSLTIVRNLVPNVHMKDDIERSRLAVSEGLSIAGPLVQGGNFPPMVTHMIQLGENSGELEPMLKIISENYEDQVDNQLSGLTSILEPIMIVVLGAVVAFVVLSVILPMLDMNKLSR